MIFTNDKVYKVLKWLGIVVFPALLTFFGVVGATLNLPYTDTVLTIGTAFVTLWNTILGVSSERYGKVGKDE